MSSGGNKRKKEKDFFKKVFKSKDDKQHLAQEKQKIQEVHGMMSSHFQSKNSPRSNKQFLGMFSVCCLKPKNFYFFF